jgi:hypothetical protein
VPWLLKLGLHPGWLCDDQDGTHRSSPHAGADSGRLFINDAQTGVMAWWSMGRWANVAAREAVIAKATTMPLTDFRVWFDRHEDSFGADEDTG